MIDAWTDPVEIFLRRVGDPVPGLCACGCGQPSTTRFRRRHNCRITRPVITEIDNGFVTGPCWVWTGARTKAGYATIRIGGRQYYVHRLTHEAVNGPIPPGLELDHLCLVKTCVRPDHLEPITHRENVQRWYMPQHAPAVAG